MSLRELARGLPPAVRRVYARRLRQEHLVLIANAGDTLALERVIAECGPGLLRAPCSCLLWRIANGLGWCEAAGRPARCEPVTIGTVVALQQQPFAPHKARALFQWLCESRMAHRLLPHLGAFEFAMHGHPPRAACLQVRLDRTLVDRELWTQMERQVQELRELDGPPTVPLRAWPLLRRLRAVCV